eukprot:tig00000117_g6353.t1
MPLSRSYEHSGQLTAAGGLLNLHPVPGQKVSLNESFPFFMASNTIEDVYKWTREILIPLLTPADGESEIYGRFQRPLSTIDIRQIYTIAELLIETPTSGFIIPSHSVRPVYIFLAENTLQNVFLAIYAGWVIAIILSEFFEMARQRLDYVGNFWNIVETLLCCLHAYLGYKFVLYYDYR